MRLTLNFTENRAHFTFVLPSIFHLYRYKIHKLVKRTVALVLANVHNLLSHTISSKSFNPLVLF